MVERKHQPHLNYNDHQITPLPLFLPCLPLIPSLSPSFPQSSHHSEYLSLFPSFTPPYSHPISPSSHPPSLISSFPSSKSPVCPYLIRWGSGGDAELPTVESMGVSLNLHQPVINSTVHVYSVVRGRILLRYWAVWNRNLYSGTELSDAEFSGSPELFDTGPFNVYLTV